MPPGDRRVQEPVARRGRSGRRTRSTSAAATGGVRVEAVADDPDPLARRRRGARATSSRGELGSPRRRGGRAGRRGAAIQPSHRRLTGPKRVRGGAAAAGRGSTRPPATARTTGTVPPKWWSRSRPSRAGSARRARSPRRAPVRAGRRRPGASTDRKPARGHGWASRAARPANTVTLDVGRCAATWPSRPHRVLLAAADLARGRARAGSRRSSSPAPRPGYAAARRSARRCRSHVKWLARSRPSWRSRSARSRSSRSRVRASASAAGSLGSTSRAASPATSAQARAGRGDHRCAVGHRLEHRQAEALPRARVGEGRGAGVERRPARPRHEAERPGPVAQRLDERLQVLVPAVRARPARGRARPGPGPRTPRPGSAGSCGARRCRPTARRAGAGPALADGRDLVVGHHRGRTPQRHQPEPVLGQAGLDRVVERSPATSRARGRASCGPARSARSKKRTPRRVKVDGSRRQARSWRVHTIGAARRRHGDAGGVDDVDRAGRPLTGGQRSRCQASYRARRGQQVLLDRDRRPVRRVGAAGGAGRSRRPRRRRSAPASTAAVSTAARAVPRGPGASTARG